MKHTASEQKLRELILHISQKCIEDNNFGVTKLNKLLAFSDFLYYAHKGRSITGETYIKKEAGPMPQSYISLSKDMKRKREIIENRRLVIDHMLNKPIPTRDPDYSVFSADEIAFVDNMIETFKNSRGTSMSRFSHDYFVGWQNVEEGEEIPYATIFFPEADEVKLTEEDKKRSLQLMKKYGWDKEYGWAQ